MIRGMIRTIDIFTTPGPVDPSVQPSGDTIFSWLDATGGFGANWGTGLELLLIGAFGALATVYFFNGESLPSMGGGARVESKEAELQGARQSRDLALSRGTEAAQKGDSRSFTAQMQLAENYAAQVKDHEEAISRERWRLLKIGMPLYILLGGVLASAIATTRIQALAVGFGWTAALQGLGLKRDRAQVKNEAKVELEKAAKDLALLERDKAVLEAKLTAAGEIAKTLAIGLSRQQGGPAALGTPASPTSPAGPASPSGSSASPSAQQLPPQVSGAPDGTSTSQGQSELTPEPVEPTPPQHDEVEDSPETGTGSDGAAGS